MNNSWGCFLYARARCIHEMLAEGKSALYIANTLSMVRPSDSGAGLMFDETQVRLIGMMPLADVAYHCDATKRSAKPEAASADAPQDAALDRREGAAAKVSEGFDIGVFVRDVSRDHEPGWAVRALPYLVALAHLTSRSDAAPEARGDGGQ